MRVLLVEDDTSVAKSIELMLQAEGFIVDTTDLGEDGLEIGKLYDYDIIILDLIDMENEEHQTAVLAELNKALSRDRTKLSVSGFSALGLVEVTRKRTRESLAHILCETCPACSGKGQVKTARTIC